jgi:hypothetical protein
MSINYPMLLAQSVILGGANPSSPIDSIVGIFTKKPNIDPTSIPGALDELWKVSMDGNTVRLRKKCKIFQRENEMFSF